MVNMRPGSYFILLSCTLLVVDILFSSFYFGISGNTASVLETYALSLLFLGVINIGVGLLLFRKIRKQEKAISISRVELSRQIRRLPSKNAAWVFMLMVVYTMSSFSLGNFLLDDITVAESLFPRLYAAALWFSLLYAFQFALFAYFIGIAVSIHTRSWFYREYQLEVPSGANTLLFRLLMGMVAIIVIPSALIVSDVWFFEDVRRLQGLSIKQAVLLDVLSMLVAATVSVFFTCRSFTIPLQDIRNAIELTSAGRKSIRAQVLTDDEIGVVAD